MRYLVFTTLLLCNFCNAYELSGQRWKENTTHFHSNIGGANSVWTSAFVSALSEWNQRSSFNFTWDAQAFNPCLDDNSNAIGFTSNLCGTSFGASTLAVTLSRYTLPANTYIETDIVFNSTVSWGVYSGLVGSGTDFKRVAIHELGHALGLSHENAKPSIMSPIIGAVEVPQTDDITGVSAIYGAQNSAKNDFDVNGQSDILLRNNLSGENWIYLLKNGSPTSNTKLNTVPLEWIIAAKGNFNSDGSTDILWRNMQTGSNWIYLMQGTQILNQYQLNNVADPQWEVVGTGDFDGSGTDDILWRHRESGLIWIYSMDEGVIDQSKRLALVSDNRWKIAAVGDFDNDQQDDILWRNQNTGHNWIYTINNLQISTSKQLNYVTDLSWQICDTGDLDGNGTDDIVWRHNENGTNYIYLMNPDLTFAPKLLNRVTDQAWKISSVGQFDTSPGEDFLWHNQSTGLFWLYSMQGNLIINSQSLGIQPSPEWQE